MRLHVGSGPHAIEGWVNLDVASLPEWPRTPDVIASVYDMPFEDNTFDFCYLGHVLEHLEFSAIPSALKEIIRVSKPGAQIMAVGPCMDLCLKTKQPDWLIEQVKESEPHNGFNHAWTPTTDLTVAALTVEGLEQIQAVDIGTVTKPHWPNPSQAPWQCAVQATVVK